jgi:hypothetical protein
MFHYQHFDDDHPYHNVIFSLSLSAAAAKSYTAIILVF